jgi:predicted RNA-binding Zn-ribbon protein involved in translation (DUF1610 family)
MERAMECDKQNQRVPLRTIERPTIGAAVTAPPVLDASSHTVDYVCGKCGTVLLRAEEGQVFGLVIECLDCGAFNATEV